MLIRNLQRRCSRCQDSMRTSGQLNQTRVPSDLRFPLYEILNRRVLQPSDVAQRDRPCLRKIRFYLEDGEARNLLQRRLLMEFIQSVRSILASTRKYCFLYLSREQKYRKIKFYNFLIVRNFPGLPLRRKSQRPRLD